MVLPRISIAMSIVLQVDPSFDPFKSVEEAIHLMTTIFGEEVRTKIITRRRYNNLHLRLAQKWRSKRQILCLGS